jgi:hypothetical protein
VKQATFGREVTGALETVSVTRSRSWSAAARVSSWAESGRAVRMRVHIIDPAVDWLHCLDTLGALVSLCERNVGIHLSCTEKALDVSTMTCRRESSGVTYDR